MDDIKKYDSVPKLQGESNIREWKDKLVRSLAWSDMAGYILVNTKRKKPHINVCVNVLMLQSLSLVVYRLSKAGYNFSTDYAVLEKDPMENYDLVVDTFSRFGKPEDTAEDLVPEFNEIKPDNFPSLMAYHGRVSYLKKRFDELGCSVNDVYAVWTVTNAFKDFNERFYEELVANMPLSWEDLMAEVFNEA